MFRPVHRMDDNMLQIQIGKEVIEYVISRRAKKYMHISIKEDGVIYVSAPKRVPNYQIENFILSQIDWIRTQKMNQNTKKNILENEGKFWYHGVCYTVYIELASCNQICFDDKVMKIKIKDIEKIYVEKVVQKWLLREAEKLYTNTTQKYLLTLKDYALPMPKIQIRKMKTRWGSCIPVKKKIALNISLMYVPIPCMEYVVLHELVHFIEANHGKNFYNIIEKIMPDWKTRKKILNKEYGNIL